MIGLGRNISSNTDESSSINLFVQKLITESYFWPGSSNWDMYLNMETQTSFFKVTDPKYLIFSVYN